MRGAALSTRTTGVLACLTLLAIACGSDSPKHDDDDAAADGGFVLTCACDEPEDCAGCFANIGRCCYDGDETILGGAPTMASRCARSPACQVCCSECAAMSCADLLASDSCPPPL